MPAFRSLSTRLTVQFALLFAAAMLVVSAALSTLIAGSSEQQVRSELAASGAVYDRLWEQRARELSSAGQLLARDFGFREAVATGDDATMDSALDNIRGRAGVGSAFIIGMDGRVHGLSGADARDAAALWDSLDQGMSRGIAMIGGRARQLVAAPILSPQPNGWLLLAADLDAREMRGLERLSAIPLNADVLIERDGGWRNATGRSTPADTRGLTIGTESFQLTTDAGMAIAIAKPLPVLGAGHRAVLLLAYPEAKALAQQHRLQLALAVLTLLGLGLMALATWRAAGRITRPLVRLDEAAAHVAAGSHAEVEVSGSDELARLGASFNAMVGEIEERERRITHLAFNDVLTGLPNRSMFQQHLEFLLKSLDGDSQIALHCLDLDNFKTVNDSLGHPAGDALLIEVSKRLSDAAKGHFVARLGGDEFVVVQPVGADRQPIERLARALHAAIGQPLAIEKQQVTPSTSIGIAVAPADGSDPSTLLKSSDLALYRAKESGRGTFAYFEQSLNERAQQRRQLETDLRLAIDHGQFELYYQPLFDLDSSQVASFEALIRWNHPTRGLISPIDFIPVAEETGLIVPIGAWVVREACREAAQWPDHVRIAVNVSSVQFHRPGLSEVIFQALAASGLPPARLEIEITESIFLEGGEATLALLHSLRALGVRIALDDFGTGYSSLSYLQSFPFDKLKIDQSFIRDLLTRPGASAVVRAITDLASALGMETTAEGVEDTAQLDQLREQGCSTVQGYLFARPMRADSVTQLLATAQRAVA